MKNLSEKLEAALRGMGQNRPPGLVAADITGQFQ
jgi:hypothetical protein